MSSNGPKQFDAFLSYNSQDQRAVEELAERLKKEKLALFLEVSELAPGREFQPALAKGLNESKTCVVFLGPNGLGPWQKQELQVAIDKRARDEAFHVIPVLLPGAERPRRGDVAHLEFLINASWVEFLKTLDDERALNRLMWGITGTTHQEPKEHYEDGICPYRGLEAFRSANAKFFFGRENLTGWLVSALRREVRAAQGVRFLGVLGSSGSGKSSVVLAGLVPQLKAGAIEGSERWPVAILRPGDDPLKNLAVGVVSQFVQADTLPDTTKVLKFIDDLRADARALDLFVQLVLSVQPEDVRLIVVVDQFEEVFTLRPQDEQAQKHFEQDRDNFFANLLMAAATPGGRVVVVLTMRSDFLSSCAPIHQLSAVLSSHQELIGPMTTAELREAIERPAFRVGCEVEPALTERLLADMKGQPGTLPLLQFALTEVWKKRDVRRLTLGAYTELGKDDKGEPRGIEGVLDHRANEIYRNLRPEDQELCRRLFLRLVQPGEGTEDTKRRVAYRELMPDNAAHAEAVKKLVKTLADRDVRLVTTEGTDAADSTVEVAHEALIRGWSRLRQWIDADRDGLRIRRQLTEAAREWQKHPGDASYLYQGTRLMEANEWAEIHPDERNSLEREFLEASIQQEQQRKADEAAALRRLSEALDTGREQAALAEEQTKVADARRIAALSESERDRHLDLALLLAVEAVGIRNTFEPRSSLLRALLARPELASFLQADEGPVESVAFSPDGSTLAAGYGRSNFGPAGGVVLWDVGRRQRLADQPWPWLRAGFPAWPSVPTARPWPPATHTAPSMAAGWWCGTWGGGSGWQTSPWPWLSGAGFPAWPSVPTARPWPPATHTAPSMAAGWWCGTWGGGSGWQTSPWPWLSGAGFPAWPSVPTARPWPPAATAVVAAK